MIRLSFHSCFAGMFSLGLMTYVGIDVARADGWQFWKPAGEPANSVPYTNTSSLVPKLPSLGVTKAASGVWSSTTSLTKKAARTTVDVVTLKPLRTPEKRPSQFRLGSHPAPRAEKPKSSWIGSLFSEKTVTRSPRTAGEFFSQGRPK